MFQGMQCLLKGQEVQEEFCLHCLMLRMRAIDVRNCSPSDSGTCRKACVISETAVTAFIHKTVTASSSTPSLCSKFQK